MHEIINLQNVSLILDKKQVPSRTSVLESKKTTSESSNALQMISIDEVLKSHKINSFDLLNSFF